MKRRKTLPILLTNQTILLIGSGNVALRKAKVLYKNNIDFHVISESVDHRMQKYTKYIQEKTFKTKDIKKYFIIVNATGNKKVTKKLLKYKEKHPLFLNIVDKPQYCDFYFMALTKNKPLQIAISTNGSSPKVAQYFRDKCQKLIPKQTTHFLKKEQKKRIKRQQKNG